MKKRWKKVLYGAVMVALAAVFVYSGYRLVSYYMDSRQNQESYDRLAQLVVERPTIPLPQTVQSTEPAETQPEDVRITVHDPETGQARKILPEYALLYTINPDLVGWISIDGTGISYPVVQSDISNPNYYLKRDFEGNYSSYGCIYASEKSDVFAPSDNVTIYGHRMGDNSMFGQLGFYTDKGFWEAHPYIRFDTLQERHLYQIICVFAISVSDGFAYHDFVNAENEEDFDAFLQQCTALRYYDTGIPAAYGDKLITLSTCEYTNENGRLVVVAKQIS